MRRPDAAVLIAILAIGTTSAGRTQQVPIFRATADIVQIDVSVLDRDRQPVHGLTAADFTVLEGGIEQPIVAFAPVDLRDTARN